MQVFFCEFCEIFKSTNFAEHLRTATSDILVNGIFPLDIYWNILFRLKQIFRPTLNESFHKLQRFIDVIKPGLQCSNQAKCCKVLLSAFPSASVKKTDDGRYISGIELNENYHLVSSPSFTAEDCYGDFTNVSVNVDESPVENLTIDPSYNEGDFYLNFCFAQEWYKHS